MSKRNGYRTKDLYIASFLSLSEKLVRFEPQADFFWFVFNNGKSCEEKVNQYWLGEIKVETKSFVNAIKNLKARVFSERQ